LEKMLLVAKSLEDEDLFEFDDEKVLLRLERLSKDNQLVNSEDLRDAADVHDS
jgi:hypothetical protein